MDPSVEVALSGMLAAAEDATPVNAVEAVTRELGTALHASSVSFLIADLSGRALVRLAHVPLGPAGGRRDGGEVATVLPFDGGPQEEALRTQAVQVNGGDPEWTVLAPVTERGEVIGLLEIVVPAEPAPQALAEIERTAHALAFVVIANRRHTDLFEWGQRTTPFNLSAEIQRRLLPAAFTCEGGSFTLSGWLEPAASVGGDTFDYSLARDTLHFSVTDAMGHGVTSALIATLGVASLRNSRRAGHSLTEQADRAGAAVAEHAPARGAFITAVLGRLDLTSGRCDLVNAGHVPPILIRGGHPEELTLPRNLALGMFPNRRVSAGAVTLEPGDRLVIVTDGMRERRAAALDLTARLRSLAALHPREAVRALADGVLDVAGPTLEDDATLLIIDWHGHHGRQRRTRAGADVSAATSADGR
ncbi:Phosphoserine phosphatase rsbP [Actinoplanes sp. SE50]|uniref:PP2C family protein-serine/threonine phosphatase n=1 Tax=unclassified Actinoplanes TaxID=2626549 RepID=UPI00023EC85A|nr:MULTISPECIES: PP2C family protein-serine/threonine phosphatase [unclassified Actinoplanes]AEV87056.1 Phosphoserine phosphatase rsbP [Actinoplanes sp. SE50/110]ATO85454.1 Phosphoserine phosphatase rsbP [Actinoplanes sp. SE50]SLM02866.1 phosphoserine phosphatase rsbP [Actinoplanes sp. SE50/110]